MVYQFKSGSHITVDAQTAGEQCEQLAREGRLTAKNLVELNRPEGAPLHDAFEWRDDVAAESWRELQGRHIIGCLTIVREEKEPQKAFFNLVRSENEYRHIETILQNQDEVALMLENALRELETFKKKYRQLRELASVFDAIDQLEIRQST